MFIPLSIKTDYSLLKSLIKIKDFNDIKNRQFSGLGITDENLFGCMEFYKMCKANNLKPIIGLEVTVNKLPIYLYAKNYYGYQNLLILNTLKQQRDLSISDIKLNRTNILVVLPFQSKEFYSEIKEDVYISYKNEYEKKNSLIITDKIVFINDVKAFKNSDLKYLRYLYLIEAGKTINEDDFKIENDYSLEVYDNISNFDKKTTIDFADNINLEFNFNQKYIPLYDKKNNSKDLLFSLCKKGLQKRLNNNINDIYLNRLKKELKVIVEMGFIDYFLIVYDYVKYAKSNDILVGPGRGSAAGSLVSYCLGITEIDPIKYNLVFERFLNKDRISMPDIDIDFEYTKRDQVIDYVKEKYGKENVGLIITFNNLKEKQVIRDVARVLNIDTKIVDELSNMINIKEKYLKNNLNNKKFVKYIKDNHLEKLFKIAMKLEGLKRHISTHAAGVVISSEKLDKIIPISLNNNTRMTGFTMDYLEEIGLLKMDFLALKNLTIINNILKDIEKNTNEKINLSQIPLDDKATLKLFNEADTLGIFQFESKGMINFLSKLKVTSFSDLIAAIALFRPGPMENIDSFIKRKHGLEKITYPVLEIEDILKETYGIIVYQEQIIEILRRVGNYSFSKADNIRKAMSKKQINIMEKERLTFIDSAINNGFSKEVATSLYDLIIKFASYGFNKAHSVSYALVGYQMAYLKVHYKEIFMANLLNNVISSDIKTKEYLDEAKKLNVTIKKPDINISTDKYIIDNKNLILPLSIIKNLGTGAVNTIMEKRKDSLFLDFFDFVARCYSKSINKKTIENLILADALNCFNYNKNTLLNNIDRAITYAELAQSIDSTLLEKPCMEIFEEMNINELNKYEKNIFGFYISNHPASKFKQEGIMKLCHMQKYFDKNIKCIVLIENIKIIQTKKNEKMAFITASDETGTAEFILFPKIYNNYINIKVGNICLIYGKVTKRFEKYQITAANITIK